MRKTRQGNQCPARSRCAEVADTYGRCAHIHLSRNGTFVNEAEVMRARAAVAARGVRTEELERRLAAQVTAKTEVEIMDAKIDPRTSSARRAMSHSQCRWQQPVEPPRRQMRLDCGFPTSNARRVVASLRAQPRQQDFLQACCCVYHCALDVLRHLSSNRSSIVSASTITQRPPLLLPRSPSM